MATIKTKLTSGRTIGMNEGIVGLTMTGEFELFEGYDGRLRTEGQHNLSREERVDIADRMIKRWMAAKAFWQGSNSSKHEFVPSKHHHFCDQCGYSRNEPLKHPQPERTA